MLGQAGNLVGASVRALPATRWPKAGSNARLLHRRPRAVSNLTVLPCDPAPYRAHFSRLVVVAPRTGHVDLLALDAEERLWFNLVMQIYPFGAAALVIRRKSVFSDVWRFARIHFPISGSSVRKGQRGMGEESINKDKGEMREDYRREDLGKGTRQSGRKRATG